MLKIDMTSFAGSMVATIVMKTTNVNKIVKANDARSPDVTGMQNTSKFTKLKSIIGITRLRNMNFELHKIQNDVCMYKYQKAKGEQYN
jgi:hypothetical protein